MEAEFRGDLRTRFFAETLKGQNRGLTLIGPAVIALGPDWSHIRLGQWPPENQEILTFNLHPNGTLSPMVHSPSPAVAELDHRLLDPSYSWVDAVDDQFRRVSDVFVLERRSWVSEPLTDSLKILGIPKAAVYAKGTAGRFQINLQIYAESPQGEPTYLTQISLGQRANPDSAQWHRLDGEFTIVGWEIPPGWRLRVDWAGINQTLDHEYLWTIPYWDADGVLTLGMDDTHPTHITIPVLKDQSTAVRQQELSSRDTKPGDFRIDQNYPNPFNAQTLIAYELPTLSSGSITIFNLLGHEVRQWSIQDQPAGKHTIVWDGKDKSGNPVSSGFYFYRIKLETGVSRTRKCLLLK
jgi:hypothetical protein